MRNVEEIMDSVASVVMVDGHHGVYVPSVFIGMYENALVIDEDVDVSKDIDIIKEHSEYSQMLPSVIDAWSYITENVLVKIEDVNYALYTNESGDLIGYSIDAYNDLSNEEQDAMWEELI